MARSWATSMAMLALGCGDGAPSDPALGALLRVDGATFYAGRMPAEDGGPRVVAAEVSSNQVTPGVRDRPLDATLGAAATSALVGLRGDEGYWVVRAGLADVEAPGLPTLHASLDFSSALEPGEQSLRIQAGDPSGRFGPPLPILLQVVPPDLPEGTLVVALSWDTEADLDLHVVLPDQTEIFARDISSLPAPKPGRPVDPDAWKAGGVLDIDSNAECVIDGRRRENVVWTVPPPSGRYLVRVDTFSLCDAFAARWDVTAVLDGRVLGHARGASGPIDAQGAHDRGAGALALTLEVP